MEASAIDRILLKVFAGIFAIATGIISVIGVVRAEHLLEAVPIVIMGVLLGFWMGRYAASAQPTISQESIPWWGTGWSLYVTTLSASHLLYRPHSDFGRVFWILSLAGGVASLWYGLYARKRPLPPEPAA
jgi:hypothetical protein